jgi:hypothetical protein
MFCCKQIMKTLLQQTMDLGEFLSKYGAELRGVRAFYIVEPLLEKGASIKFGVAGMDSGNAYERFRSYAILYGGKSKDNECKGVLVHYVGIVKYNRLVEKTNAEVWKLERFLKSEYKTVTDPDRGEERVPKKHLPTIMRYIRSKKFSDVETVLRPGQRPATEKHRVNRTSHKTGDRPQGATTRARKKS